MQINRSRRCQTGLSNYDVNDGPRCTQFDVVHVSSNNIFRVEASFVIHLVQFNDNGAALENVTGVLAHRWACTDTLDHNLRLTRTYRGLLELATSNFSPHWFRYLVVPPLQPGMRRDQMDFIATERWKAIAIQDPRFRRGSVGTVTRATLVCRTQRADVKPRWTEGDV